MISFFPDSYNDELLYSVLARYYEHSPYVRYIDVAKELFESKTTRPNPLFVNLYSDDALRQITRYESMESCVRNHTMFPEARFLPLMRRKKALEMLINMDSSYHDAMLLPKAQNGERRTLKYCPLCAAQDRASYGETYWHRSHQIRGIDVCPIHCCFLNNSDVLISAKSSPSLISAETVIAKDEEPVYCLNDVEVRLVRYINEVFSLNVNMENDVSVGAFLNYKLNETKYLSPRGGHRYMDKLVEDFNAFYSGYSENCQLLQRWQIDKIFNGRIRSVHEVCMLSMFLDVQPDELVFMSLPEKPLPKQFDEQIRALHDSGMSYPKIAACIGVSVNVVKPAGEGKYGKDKKQRSTPHRKGSPKKLSWDTIDRELLPKVKIVAAQIWGPGDQRPRKVTARRIERTLGIPSMRLNHCPKCLRVINRYHETTQQYWGREMMWAARSLKSQGKEINITGIMRLTNTKREDLCSALPFICKQDDQVLVKEILNLFSASDK